MLPDAPLRLLRTHHDSALGRWSSAVWLPEPPLSGEVLSIWQSDAWINYRREKILPHGGVDLIFNLGPSQSLLDNDDYARATEFRGAFLSGVHQQYLVTESGARSHLMGVRFTALGAWRFFGLPQLELTDRVLEPDAVLGAEAREIEQRLLNANSLEARFALLIAWLSRRFARAPQVHPAPRWALEQIAASAGRVAIRELTRELGYSERHLANLFARTVGVTPKRYARILRFGHAVARLQRDPGADLAALAAACGYYDQPHFARDFRAFAGATPGEFARNGNTDGVTPSLVVD